MLRFETYSIPAANLGPENPLPPLQRSPGINFVSGAKAESNIPPEDLEGLGLGFDIGLLPYRMQDDYDRDRQPRDFDVAVLENDTLRATFLLEYGGRLWSLIHKPTGRELLYRNPVFQPANLAVRNAWFSGGVEWNVSVPGHTPLTCAPLFAARAEDEDGNPVLRMYEWERARGMTFQIDAYLKEDSPLLYVRVTLNNPQDHLLPMYWWSNIAVPESEDVRVIVPAEQAYRYSYEGGLRQTPVPHKDGQDHSYSTNIPTAVDYFFRIPNGERPWIAALDGTGRGLIQASTPRLTGRKLFAWGVNAGGQRWQEFLAEPELPYIEIQAGLARTQSHCLPMPPQSTWSWTEVYGLMEADPTLAHSPDWSIARGEVNSHLEAKITAAELEAEHLRMTSTAEAPPQSLHRYGSGWGALETKRREKNDEPAFAPASQLYPSDSIGPEESSWLALLDSGQLPPRTPDQIPGSYMVQSQWRELLQASAGESNTDWLSWLHLGVMNYQAGNFLAAECAWKASLEATPNAWAWRNLAVLAHDNKDLSKSADFYLKAVELAPHIRQLAGECLEALINSDRSEEVPALLASLPAEITSHGRIQLLEARAALARDDLHIVEQLFLKSLDIPDIREGEVSLSDLWFGMHEKKLAAEQSRAIDDDIRSTVRFQFPPPRHIDFRMTAN